MLLDSIHRIIGRQWRGKFKALPFLRTEEFEIPYDEIATIYLNKKHSQTKDPIFQNFVEKS